jgi:DNA-directed RNA polymerase subunit RPC12/RpoP
MKVSLVKSGAFTYTEYRCPDCNGWSQTSVPKGGTKTMDCIYCGAKILFEDK